MGTQTTNRPAVRQQPAEPDQSKALEALEQLANTYGLAALDEITNRFERALKLAQGLQALRLAVGPIMPQIAALQGSKLGFRTDKDGNGGYDQDTVRDCFIEATLRGFAPTGNEWNIISGGFYGTKEGWEARVKAVKGLTDLKVQAGVPAAQPNGALVPFTATWNLNGRPMRMDCQKRGDLDDRIPVRLDRPGVDAAIGKAERKLYYRIYKRVTGTTWTDQDMEDALPPQLPAPAQRPGNGAALPNGPAAGQVTDAQLRTIRQLSAGLDEAECLALLPDGCGDPAELTAAGAEALLARLRELAARAGAGREPGAEG
jgi:hypothetical protein